MKPKQLYKGAQVRFEDNKVLWFKNNLNGIFGFFTSEQGMGSFKRKYSTIESIDGRRLNEIKRLQELAGINEIKINKPNIYFKSTGEIIDDDGENIWTEFIPNWNESQKLYSSYSIEGNNIQIMLDATTDEEQLVIDEFISKLKKYNIPNNMDYDSDETGINLYNFWIDKKYFVLPK